MKPILFNFTDAELEQFITNLGQPKFRAKQIREWLNRGTPDFMSMKTSQKHCVKTWIKTHKHYQLKL